jgi:hypothetical protein
LTLGSTTSVLWAVSFPLLAFMNLPISAGCWWLLWVVGFQSLLLSVFAALWHFVESSALSTQFLATPMTVQQWEISSLLLCYSLGQVQHSTPPLMLVLDYSLLFMAFSFAVRGFIPPMDCAGLFSWHGVGE